MSGKAGLAGLMPYSQSMMMTRGAFSFIIDTQGDDDITSGTSFGTKRKFWEIQAGGLFPANATTIFSIDRDGMITASGDISGALHVEALSGSFGRVETNAFAGSRPINTKTADGTLAIADAGTYFRCGSHKLTIVANSSVAYPIGTEIDFIQTSSEGHLMVTASSGVTINSRHQLFSASGQFSAISCKKVGTDEWDMIGDLTA